MGIERGMELGQQWRWACFTRWQHLLFSPEGDIDAGLVMDISIGVERAHTHQADWADRAGPRLEANKAGNRSQMRKA